MKFDLSTAIIALVIVMSLLRHVFNGAFAWRRLRKYYPAKRAPMGRIVSASSLRIGETYVGPLVTFRVSPRGLYFSQPVPLSLVMPPMMVPWSEMRIEKYIRMPMFRGYHVRLVDEGREEQENAAGKPDLFLPDKVIRTARTFIDVPSEERPGW